MPGPDLNDLDALLTNVRAQADAQELRVTQHAQQEMVEENIRMDDVLAAMKNGKIIENYPQHQRGACCLINGADVSSRWLHIVCTTTREKLIIITVYEPKLPKWLSPTQRRSAP